MRYRHFAFVTGLVLVMSLTEGQVTAQAPAASANPTSIKKVWKVSRTPDGQPDLQGVWANNNATPLERPTVLAGRTTLTDEEVAALKKKAGELFNGDGDAAFGDEIFRSVLESVKAGQSAPYRKASDEFDFGTGDYNSFWLVQRDWDNRTSLITDPPDGRLPPMTPRGLTRRDEAAAERRRPAQGPEDRSLGERCITFGTPSLRAGYNSYYQIVQTPGYVIILMEMAHDARIIPLDARPHLPSTVHQWMGDSRGHWEGDTLVVDTTNYAPQASRPPRAPGCASSSVLPERAPRTSSMNSRSMIQIRGPNRGA